MICSKSNKLFEMEDDVEMRDQSLTRDETGPISFGAKTKRSLMDQFNQPENRIPSLNNFINFSDSDEDKSDEISGKIIKKSIKRIETRDEPNSLRKRKKDKRKTKIGPPPMYTTRQFSFNQANSDNKGPTQDIDEDDRCEGQAIFEKVFCKKNLFGQDDENKNPNFDTQMHESPDRKEGAILEENKLNIHPRNVNCEILTDSPHNLIQKWNKGDIIFKGKYSSGITPKMERKVIKGIKIRNKFPKTKNGIIEEMEDSDSKEN
jgi:hypothetical protein